MMQNKKDKSLIVLSQECIKQADTFPPREPNSIIV